MSKLIETSSSIYDPKHKEVVINPENNPPDKLIIIRRIIQLYDALEKFILKHQNQRQRYILDVVYMDSQ